MRTGRFHAAHPGFYSDFECATDINAARDIIVFHDIRVKSGYAGAGFQAAGDVIPDVDPHDAFMDVILTSYWPPMRDAMLAYLERGNHA